MFALFVDISIKQQPPHCGPRTYRSGWEACSSPRPTSQRPGSSWPRPTIGPWRSCCWTCRSWAPRWPPWTTVASLSQVSTVTVAARLADQLVSFNCFFMFILCLTMSKSNVHVWMIKFILSYFSQWSVVECGWWVVGQRSDLSNVRGYMGNGHIHMWGWKTWTL